MVVTDLCYEVISLERLLEVSEVNARALERASSYWAAPIEKMRRARLSDLERALAEVLVALDQYGLRMRVEKQQPGYYEVLLCGLSKSFQDKRLRGKDEQDTSLPRLKENISLGLKNLEFRTFSLEGSAGKWLKELQALAENARSEREGTMRLHFRKNVAALPPYFRYASYRRDESFSNETLKRWLEETLTTEGDGDGTFPWFLCEEILEAA